MTLRTRKIGLLVTAIVVLLIAILQRTPLAFLPETATDLVSGMAAGLWFGVLFTWLANRGSFD